MMGDGRDGPVGRGTWPVHPVAVAVAVALMWGVWWMPLRAIEATGMSAEWASAAMNLGGAAAMGVAWTLLRGRFEMPRATVTGALLMGLAIASYSFALAAGEVVRAVLIFYLAPVWSKLIEWVFLDRPWGRASSLAMVLAFSGILLLTGGTFGESGIGMADGLALISGMAWAGGSAIVFQKGGGNTLDVATLACAGAALVSLAFAFLLDPSVESTAEAIALGGLTGAAYVGPIMLLTALSAIALPPATLSFLLSAEIASGVISSAIFLDEPFGWAHVAGAVLIALAATAEIVFAPGRRAA